jgi:membrane protease YdiL (CAAX protease family)
VTAAAVALTAVLAALAIAFAPRRAAANVAALRRDLETDPRARERFYGRAILSIPLVVALYAVVVLAGGGSWRDAGLSWDRDASRLAVPTSIAALAAALAAVALVALVVGALRPGAIERANEATKVIAPATPRERRLWLLVSLSAGVTEELVYRGLFVLHLNALVPSLRPGPLAVLAALAFGIAHRYQGPFGVVSSAILGLAFGIVAIVVGNVLVVVALHTLWDVVAGFVKREVGDAGTAEQGRPAEAP